MKQQYFDASYLVKLHLREQGTEEVLRQATQSASLACSLHGRAEMVSTLHRKLREGAIGAALMAGVLEQIELATKAGAIVWLPLNERVVERVETAYKTLPTKLFLRAADALHLASAAEHGLGELYSNDRHLLAAAPCFGLLGVNVIPTV